jgi:signal transduction histidine kinase
MHTDMAFFLNLLAQFGGGRNDPYNNFVRFGLASLFWGVLVLVAYNRRKKGNAPRERILFYGFSLGLARELFMFGIVLLVQLKIVDSSLLHPIFPPIEHVLTQMSVIVIAAAFMHYLADQPSLSQRYLITGIATTLLCYLATFLWWGTFSQAHPSAKFSTTWCHRAFHISAILLIAYPIIQLLKSKKVGRSVVIAALTMFFLDELLSLIYAAGGSLHQEIYRPIRHNLHLWAIPLLGIVYFKEMSLEQEINMDRLKKSRTKLAQSYKTLQREVKEREDAEQRLIRSERKYRHLTQEFHTLLDAIPDTLLLVSPDMRILWANRGAAEGLLCEVADLEGEFCYKLRHNRSEPCPECQAVKCFASGKTEHMQKTTPDGRIWDVRAHPIKDGEGRVISAIELAIDITEKITLEAETLRTGHLTSLGELSAGVAHEINNPINGIINYAQILANQSNDGSREKEIAGRIIKEGDRVVRIVKSLLSFARERKEEKVSLRIQEVISDCLILTETYLRKSGIHLATDFPATLPMVVANPQQIQQVFLNIINNAQYALNEKYTKGDEKKILRISGTVLSNNGQPFLRVTFLDQGTGVPDAHIDKILAPFFTTKPRGQGTGLGLSISHGIIKDHKGNLQIVSRPGEDTKVIIDLPVRQEGEAWTRPKY